MALVLAAQTFCWGQTAGDSYLEFGTVVAMSRRDVAVQTYDTRLERTVQRTFVLGKDTRADTVRVGDTVEIIYSAGGMADASEYVLKRLIALGGTTLPKIGPAPSGGVATGTGGAMAMTSQLARPGAAGGTLATVPARATVTTPLPGKSGPAPAVPAANSAVGLGRTGNAATAKTAATPAGRSAKVPAANTAVNTQPVTLPPTVTRKVPGAVSVAMGASTDAASPKTPKVKTVTQETPGEQCGREADWQTQPISLAVLDFRYPTEHEEANDVAKTGGGSGTAVADLVYNRLDGQTEFTLRRGDREKLYRMDFAGAARLGRQIGVDVVLLGTFSAVDVVSPDPNYPAPTQAYTLRAGVVETCTGQLLYKLSSITCPASGGPAICPGSQITVKDAVNPLENAAAFRLPIENLLGPLLHNGTPAGQIGTAGVVTAFGGVKMTIRLREPGVVKVGDQVSIHGFRLAKNPTTSTLQRFEDTEMGRMTVERVTGGSAEGTYQGDVPAKVGDTAEVITE